MVMEVPVVKAACDTRKESKVFCKKSLDVKSFRSGICSASMGTSSSYDVYYSIEEKEQKEKKIFS